MNTSTSQSEGSFNEVVLNDDFQRALKPYTIKLIAPASGNPLNTVSKLCALPKLKIDSSALLINEDCIFHASNDEERVLMLQNALYGTEEQSIIWTLRGGYGSARLIDTLKRRPPPEKPKIFIGFSDNTALHLFFTQHWNWKTIHGSGFAQLLDTQQDKLNFLKIAKLLAKKESNPTLPDLKPLNNSAMKTECVQGRLTGGNLTLVECSIGTDWQIETQGKIVFLEEIGEKGYRIDRSLYHFYQAGIFKDVQAIVFGEMLCPQQENEIQFALQRFAQNTTVPVYQSSLFGHGNVNYPLVYNANAEILPYEQNTFSLQMMGYTID